MLAEVVLGATAVSAAFGGWAAARGHRVRRVIDALRERLDDAEVGIGAHGRLEASGSIDGVEVRIAHVSTRPPGPGAPTLGTRIAARLSPHLRALDVAPSTVGLADVLDLRPRPATGDEAFDRRTVVRGPERVVGPALDEASRALLAGLVHARRGRVRRGWVELTLPGAEWCLDVLEDNLGLILRIRAALDFEAPEAAARLERIAARDGVSAVRRLALRRLVEHHAGEAPTERALATALASETPRLRIIAASARPAEGPAVVRALLDAPTLDLEDRARALGVLARLEHDGAAREELHRLLEAGPAGAQVAAAEALAELGGREVASALHELAHRMFTRPEVRRAATLALDRVRARFEGDSAGALSLCAPVGSGALALADAPSSGLGERG